MSEKNDGYIHSGHRKRVRERYRQEGLDGFNDINALEMLLFYAQQSGDTNPLAHKLLNRFGSLQGVLNATYSELKSVDGVGDYIATYLRFVADFNRRCQLPGKGTIQPSICNAKAAAEYLRPFFLTARDEIVLGLFLNNQKKPICCRELSRGIVNAAEVSTRRLAEIALESKAEAVILSHNHPGGSPEPSEADIAATRRLQSALAGIGIELCDHVIIGETEYYSLKEHREI